ncbi:ImmA/IrrE family metallo-endopeptidase [Lentibacter algarum]|uniref:ImmA/IrrE family metallo-endopeptidase n=1 Tax=Lentibacter algarum TaxID=576131 RepID=UPI001C098A71|nr:ImmA/IrrE family metallo-endopeptidase [Lentibacter algarum]MBU2983282.1 ImmA/IrrE family metallo-endopeptidase [Lentibacter algarum]
MKRPDYKRARAEAARLLKHYSIRSLPIDPEAIAESEGINVVYVEFNEKASKLISGLYDFNAQKIYVNKTLPSNRKTFTIAHELAHAILHQEYAESTDYRAMPRSNVHFDKPPEEKEADVFAACLLVPPSALKKYKDVASIEELSSMFAVSRDVVTAQMDFL